MRRRVSTHSNPHQSLDRRANSRLSVIAPRTSSSPRAVQCPKRSDQLHPVAAMARGRTARAHAATRFVQRPRLSRVHFVLARK